MKTITIPAAQNGTAGVYNERMDVPGFSVVSATAAFAVVVNQQKRTVAQGQAVGSDSGKVLGQVSFENSTTSAITVGIGDFSDARATSIAAVAGTVIGANSNLYDLGTSGSPTGQTFAGIDSLGRARKTITITNYGRLTVGGGTSTALVFVYLNGGTSPTFAVFPGTSATLETSADIYMQCGAADLTAGPTHLQVSVLEIFYSKALQTDQ